MPNNDDESDEYTLTDVIRVGVESALSEVYTSLPATVIRGPGEQYTIDVELLTKERYQDEEGNWVTASRPVLLDVPIIYPGSAYKNDYFRLTFPVGPGDQVLCIFSSEALQHWKRVGFSTDPGSTRRHHLADAIAIPGLIPPFAKAGNNAPLGRDTIALHSSKYVCLGSSDADDAVVREVDLKSVFLNVLTDPGVLAGIKAYTVALDPTSVTAAIGAILEALNNHFTAHAYGSTKVFAD